MAWECKGKRLDGTFSSIGEHRARSVEENRCMECNLSRSEVEGSTSRRGKLPPQVYAIPIAFIVGGLAWAITNSQPARVVNLTASEKLAPPAQCPFANCQLIIGAVTARVGNSGSNGTSSENNSPSTEEASCAGGKSSTANLTISSPAPDRTSKPPSREELRTYLEVEFKKYYPSIQVKLDESLDVARQDRNKVAEEKIKGKEWDIAFTGSPLIALGAREHGYQFAFAPKVRGQSSLETSIFVRRDSSIKALGDLTANKVIALGSTDNLVGFYMPVYDLYGTKVRIKPGNQLSKIPKMVLCKEVDAGVGPSRLVKGNPNFTVLSNRTIKPGGIYFSPKLSPDAQRLLKQIFNSAPENIQFAAGYDLQGQEPDNSDYDRVQKIKERAEELIAKIEPISKSAPIQIVGTIENIRHVRADRDSISIKIQTGTVYEVQISPILIKQLNVDPDKLIKKRVEIYDLKADEKNVFQVNTIDQIKLQ
jgi:ABC transporter, phosphonate, periplasmic substrate-binding protein